MSILINHYSTPFGELILGSFNEKLCLCDWKLRKARKSIDSRLQQALKASYVEGDSNVIRETKKQLDQYFAGNRKTFDLPLLFIGTSFQENVWNALQSIPYGSIETYGSLSDKLSNSKAVRAIANANGANAISIVVPCHRVIGANKQLTGYAGGLDAKKGLLLLEGISLTS